MKRDAYGEFFMFGFFDAIRRATIDRRRKICFLDFGLSMYVIG